MKKTYLIVDDTDRYAFIREARQWQLVKPIELVVRHVSKIRSDEQSNKMWAMLGDISTQVIWHDQELSKESWKDIFTAALKRQKVVPGLDGGFVVLGTSTRKMNKADMSELIELMYAFGSDHDVVWTEPKEKKRAA